MLSPGGPRPWLRWKGLQMTALAPLSVGGPYRLMWASLFRKDLVPINVAGVVPLLIFRGFLQTQDLGFLL